MTPEDQLQLWLLGGAIAASLLLWAWLGVRMSAGGVVLQYRPRWRVPWTASVGLFAVAWSFVSILPALLMPDPVVGGTAPPELTPNDFAHLNAANTVFQLTIVLFGVVWLRAGLGASWRDLGLPTSWAGAGSDFKLGLAIFVASMAPVYALMALFSLLDFGSQPHPSLVRIAADPTWMVAGAALLAAVVGAPLFEEFLFRLLLQGWLEKVEDRGVGWDATRRPGTPKEGEDASDFDALQPTDAAQAEKENPYASPRSATTYASDLPEPQDFDEDARRKLVSVSGLPHGWAPILFTALLFAVGHFEQGTAVVPLFLFGAILGYAYQRTHRILPCVIAHMAFNGFSLVVFWLSLQLGG